MKSNLLTGIFSRRPQTPHELAKLLDLPEESETRFLFCDSNKLVRIKTWFDALPVTDYATTSTHLYHALPEIAKVRLTTNVRAELLEHIRPLVLNCVASIIDPLVKKPLTLNESEKKSVVISQALLKHLANGYARNAISALTERKLSSQAASLALHRALSTLSLFLATNYRFYTPVPPHIWGMLNTLYRFSRSHGLNGKNVTDPLAADFSGNCDHSYLCSLALACARPLQLRSSEIDLLYRKLGPWVKLLKLETYQANNQALFAVLSSADAEPDYLDTFEAEQLAADGLVFDFQALLTNLEKKPETPLEEKNEIPRNLRQHLFQHWGSRVHRRNPRNPCNHELEVCVGLANIHSQLIKGISFEDFVFGGASNDSLVLGSNWKTNTQRSDGAPVNSATYTVVIKNSGARGFQIQWQQVPPQLQAGELIAYREAGKRHWQLATIRWVRRSDSQGVQSGAQALAHKMEAYGASTITNNGKDSDYMRVLLLSEGGDESNLSIVMPNLVFSERHPVTLKKRGVVTKIQLTQRLLTTASFCHFRYKSG
ncbi:hypothetical protein [Halioxenophilus sp. WMMB6]|uniref:hypothetical protein n=1 Tax=Halioxenophilus sp. WMMB6 TaxID=3073815 RepID=UPI00295E817D|nr:hypothetical protein [Halioxenophilus sp. WMMB6]